MLTAYPGRFDLVDRFVPPLVPPAIAFRLHLEYVGRRVESHPAFQELLRSGKSPDGAKPLARQLAAKGRRRLSDGELVDRATLFAGMLARLDENECASLARGGADEEQVLAAVQKADPASVRRWLDLAGTAAIAELEQRPVPFVSETERSDAWAAFRSRLPSDAAERLSAIGRNRQASNADLCWAGRTVYRRALDLPEGQRAIFLRGIELWEPTR